mmetsp:Transcript_53957/g.148814  ORF Transcript_53957/g.148814 Transcript_53957/m.148814 type:complete len:319 (+) Transcript_53957:61-1017(+)
MTRSRPGSAWGLSRRSSSSTHDRTASALTSALLGSCQRAQTDRHTTHTKTGTRQPEPRKPYTRVQGAPPAPHASVSAGERVDGDVAVDDARALGTALAGRTEERVAGPRVEPARQRPSAAPHLEREHHPVPHRAAHAAQVLGHVADARVCAREGKAGVHLPHLILDGDERATGVDDKALAHAEGPSRVDDALVGSAHRAAEHAGDVELLRGAGDARPVARRVVPVWLALALMRRHLHHVLVGLERVQLVAGHAAHVISVAVVVVERRAGGHALRRQPRHRHPVKRRVAAARDVCKVDCVAQALVDCDRVRGGSQPSAG